VRTRKFTYNIVSASTLQVAALVAGFVVPRVMLSYYGSEVNGLTMSITQFVSYFSLLEAGLSGAAIFSLYRPLAERNHALVNAILSLTKRDYWVSGTVYLGLLLCLCMVYPKFVLSETLTVYDIIALTFVCGITGVFNFIVIGKYSVLLTADQRVYMLSLSSIISVVVSAGLIWFFAFIGFGVIAVRAIALVALLLRSGILNWYIHRFYPWVSYGTDFTRISLPKRWDVFYLQILGVVQTATPIIIATAFVALKDVSVYAIYNMVIAGVISCLGVFVAGLSASFGEVISKGQVAILQRAYREFECFYYMFSAWAFACLQILMIPFIRIYTRGITDAVYDLPTLGFLFVLNAIFYTLKTPQGLMVISAGMYRETRWQTSLQAAILLIFGPILAYYWGLVGILAASILSNLYRCFDLLFFVPKKITGLPVRESIWRAGRLFASILLSVLPFLFYTLNPSGYLEFFWDAIGVSIYVAAVVVLVNIIPERVILKSGLSRLKFAYGAPEVAL
jgi:hypothetical protein